MTERESSPALEILEDVLQRFVAAGNSRRPLEAVPDADYGVLFAFDVTPCCVPLSSVAWLNPVTPGFFFRCTIARATPEEARPRVTALLNSLNHGLPAGAFVLDPTSGAVLFKHAVYFGATPLTEDLVVGVLAPAAEFIGMHWQAVLQAVLGASAPTHTHSTNPIDGPA